MAALAVCAPLVLLGACSDDSAQGDGGASASTPSASTTSASEPGAESPSASESPSENPSKKYPKRYPEDKSASKISAELVAVKYIEAYNHALGTGDTARMRHMAGPNCQQCDEFADQVEEYYGAGGAIESDGVPNKVTRRKMIEASSAKRVIWLLDIHAAGGETTSKAGDEPVDFGPRDFSLTFILGVVDDHWVVRTLGFGS
ncbi:MAG: DUF6318 family protein [Nocardioides sp.]|nr:DUF6318 family protein [Nocardioides sp.]